MNKMQLPVNIFTPVKILHEVMLSCYTKKGNNFTTKNVAFQLKKILQSKKSANEKKKYTRRMITILK